MDDPSEFAKQLRDALEHLYNTARLERHPLGEQLILAPASSRLTRAQMLRAVLKDGIEALRPPDGTPRSAPESRSYLALRYRYIQGMSLGQVENELGISPRQLHRELRAGLDALAGLLRDRVREQAAQLAQPEQADEQQPLQQELEQWQMNRQFCAVHTLLEDTLWTLRPLLEQTGVPVQVNLPESLPPIFVDPTMTRQALLQVLRLLVRAHPGGQVNVEGIEQGRALDLLISSGAAEIQESEESWQLALLILRRQAGRLSLHRTSHATRVTVSLPVSGRARVLVIDDAVAIHRLFERYLAPHDYEVACATQGVEALELAARSRPDMIILDVMMPTMDGWQVLRALQGDPATADIPVIVCSVLKEPELALSLGARAFVKKPVDRLELIRVLETIRQSGGSPAPTL